jgi:hypothetical protein
MSTETSKPIESAALTVLRYNVAYVKALRAADLFEAHDHNAMIRQSCCQGISVAWLVGSDLGDGGTSDEYKTAIDLLNEMHECLK